MGCSDGPRVDYTNSKADRRPALSSVSGPVPLHEGRNPIVDFAAQRPSRVGQSDAQMCVTQELLEVGRIAPLGIERVEQGVQLPRSELQHSRHS